MSTSRVLIRLFLQKKNAARYIAGSRLPDRTLPRIDAIAGERAPSDTPHDYAVTYRVAVRDEVDDQLVALIPPSGSA